MLASSLPPPSPPPRPTRHHRQPSGKITGFFTANFSTGKKTYKGEFIREKLLYSHLFQYGLRKAYYFCYFLSITNRNRTASFLSVYPSYFCLAWKQLTKSKFRICHERICVYVAVHITLCMFLFFSDVVGIYTWKITCARACVHT